MKNYINRLAVAIRIMILKALNAVDKTYHEDVCADCHATGFTEGYRGGHAIGERKAKLKFAVLPLPFTESQLLGREYGEFITPINFGIDAFGECNIPAPGPHGYEQRAYYVGKSDLENRPNGTDLRCHHASKFADPQNSDQLVPVILTVLR